MKSEPLIEKEKFITFISNTYKLSVSHLEFLPKGETSWGYIIDTDRDKYFLKIYTETVPFLEAAAELTYRLYNECGITEIVHTVHGVDGNIIHDFQGYKATLSNYIEGIEIREQKLNNQELGELGKIIGRIHTSTTKIGAYPKLETFDCKDKDNFLRVIKRLKSHQTNELSYQKEFIDLMFPLREKMMDELTSLEKLATHLKTKSIPFVICHGDPTPGNILLSTDKKLYIIDWDSPLLAPKERDLVFFTSNLEPCMNGYVSVVGETSIDESVRKFYIHAWNVQEVAFLGKRILFQNNSNEQNKHDLEETHEFLRYSGLGII